MQRGHVTGNKKERTSKGSNWWYKQLTDAEMMNIEREWEAEAILRQPEAECEAKQTTQAST
jgi:hypothetical protein